MIDTLLGVSHRAEQMKIYSSSWTLQSGEKDVLKHTHLPLPFSHGAEQEHCGMLWAASLTVPELAELRRELMLLLMDSRQ